ncbi:MAG: hypothetical protein Q8R96_03195 [Bacteroidota bacterium]|nr:hypothetical protein [Bacteroidota bacterium]
MNKNLSDSIIGVCQILNKHSVEYLIVGGAAVALFGYFRLSTSMAGKPSEKQDLDFWYNPTYTNYFRLLDALEELGQNVSDYKREKTPNPKKSFFKFEDEKFTLDFLPELKSLSSFITAYKKREIARLIDIEIPFIGFDDLIKDKEANSRPKDKIDIEQLKIRRSR